MREGKLWTSDHGKIVIDEGAVVIYDFNENEVVYFDHQEWRADPEVAQAVLHLLQMAVTEGVGAVARYVKERGEGWKAQLREALDG